MTFWEFTLYSTTRLVFLRQTMLLDKRNVVGYHINMVVKRESDPFLKIAFFFLFFLSSWLLLTVLLDHILYKINLSFLNLYYFPPIVLFLICGMLKRVEIVFLLLYTYLIKWLILLHATEPIMQNILLTVRK